jgi:hypothetical protein
MSEGLLAFRSLALVPGLCSFAMYVLALSCSSGGPAIFSATAAAVAASLSPT